MFPDEKQHLQQVSSILSYKNINVQSITRNVSKDNTIRYKSNRYSVPLGTYIASDNQVFIEIKPSEPQTLLIRKQLDGDVIAEHRISIEKGKLIQNRNHTRDRSKGIEEAKLRLISHFKNQERAASYLHEICLRYPRYRRDQLAIIQDAIQKEPKWMEAALFKCIRDRLYNANDFRDVVHHLKSLSIESTAKSNRPVLEQVNKGGILLTTRSLETYTNILGGTQ